MRAVLTIWTIYDNPRDYPGKLVAREWQVREDMVVATDNTIVVASDRYDVMEAMMMQKGLIKLEPLPGDDPVIRETWL